LLLGTGSLVPEAITLLTVNPPVPLIVVLRVQAAEATERAVQVDPAKAIEAERAELMAEMQDLKAMESALELQPGKFEAEDKLIADAETLAKAADAMARCQLRN
jgi:hypothetical protein